MRIGRLIDRVLSKGDSEELANLRNRYLEGKISADELDHEMQENYLDNRNRGVGAIPDLGVKAGLGFMGLVSFILGYDYINEEVHDLDQYLEVVDNLEIPPFHPGIAVPGIVMTYLATLKSIESAEEFRKGYTEGRYGPGKKIDQPHKHETSSAYFETNSNDLEAEKNS